MKKFLSLLLVLIIVITVFVIYKKCNTPTDEELITERIELFLTAYNDGDMDAVLSCLDAKTRNAYQSVLNLFGEFVGSKIGFNIDLSDLFSLGVNTSSGDFMELEITDITVLDSKNATVTTNMDLAGSGTRTIYFVMVYENNSWYIHDMTDKKI